ncbi:MAG: bifunctional UDP-N-acetylglucosamine diphosphorylase/glucosamine-1-phosphate N-acetyltransferase GlmU [Nocardioides sp.]|jgi:bifunctional UDP-N-acetylglucosamine pyrophosphorylase/glucosamine-1-phosphate N-acetyltransferase
MAHDVTVIVLAAGGGTRMKSKTMKVLHPVAGRSMVGHVLTAVRAVQPTQLVAVVGHQRDQVGPHIQQLAPDAVLAVQEVLDGTGGAVRIATQALKPKGTVLVLTGDTPLLEGASLKAFAEEHEAAQRAVSILTGVVERPTGYGRIVRNDEGDVEAIVEEKDASPEQRGIHEINSGILAFEAEFLLSALPRLSNDNANGEFYLTDTVGIAREDGLTVGAYQIHDVRQTEGANDRAQLAELGRELNQRIVNRWMKDGVTIMDPATTWIETDVVLEPDVTILPGTQLLGATLIREDAVVGPDTTLKDCEVGVGARVSRTHGELAVIGDGANVGPFTHLRPGTQLGAGGKIGSFAETKNAVIGENGKVPHLIYVGDAEIGADANIGAGTIFANYDGSKKHRTTVGARARVGSNNTLVAPVSVGEGAVTGGGAVIREDVPAGALAVSAGKQRNIEGHVERKRSGAAES